MEKVKFFFDPRCPWCYLTSRWAVQLERLGEITLDWGALSLQIVNAEEGTDVRSLDPQSTAALRTISALRKEGRPEMIGPFYTALGKRLWETAPPVTDAVVASREALSEIGLDPGLCDKALVDASAWDEIIAEHDALVARTKSFGVPTIVLDGGDGPAIFGPVISSSPDDKTAVELWRHVSWLTRYENFSELKRARTAPPDLPAAAWRREQRALEEAHK